MLKRICHFYNTTGKCRFGKHCRNSHDIDSRSNYQSTSDPNRRENSNCVTGHNLVHQSSTPGHVNDNQDNGSLSSNQELSEEQVEGKLQNLNLSKSPEENGSLNNKSAKAPRVSEERICRFYARNRFCRYGKKCVFQHVLPPKSKENKGPNKADKDLKVRKKEEDNQDGETGNKQTDSLQDEGTDKTKEKHELTSKQQAKQKDVKEKKPRRRLCRDFKAGECRFGRHCKYYHPPDPLDVESELGEEKERKTSAKEKPSQVGKAAHPVATRRQQVFKRSEVTKEKLKEIRNTEIEQLKKRFPTDDLETVIDTDEKSTFIFDFSPTDPDWPYDVRVFRFEVTFVDEYPLQMFGISLLEDEIIPDSVSEYIVTSIHEWLKKKAAEYERKQIVELLFRPFLRWLDRSIEKIVTEGLMQLKREVTAQSYGFEFIPAKPVQKTAVPEVVVAPDTVTVTTEEESPVERGGVEYRKTEQEPDEEYTGPAERNSSEDEDWDQDNEDEEITQQGALPETERKGTELHLRNMQLQWHVGTMFVEKIFLIVQCERCKFQTEFSTPPHRVSSVTCAKCRNPQYVKYRPVLAHHYSDIIGYLDLDGCAVHDCVLQKCVFTVGCYTCNRTYSCKTLLAGILHEAFCQGCHNKLKFSVDSVRFNKLIPSDSSLGKGKVHRVHVPGLKKTQKDPAIQEGRPLPDNGICKHYKKSFRWLRFPCCGKCYPCDLCHDEKEMDHDMKWATRMICGYCCKEQVYAGDKACIACGSSMTRSHSTHWEGGKGCRNKTTMSRDDTQKYSNLNKTVSNKAMNQLQKYKAKKKKT